MKNVKMSINRQNFIPWYLSCQFLFLNINYEKYQQQPFFFYFSLWPADFNFIGFYTNFYPTLFDG